MLKKSFLLLTALTMFCVSCGQEKVDTSDAVLASKRFSLYDLSSFDVDAQHITPNSPLYESLVEYHLETGVQLYKTQKDSISLEVGIYVQPEKIMNLYEKRTGYGLPDFDVCLKANNFFGDNSCVSYSVIDYQRICNNEFVRYTLDGTIIKAFKTTMQFTYDGFIQDEGYLEYEIGFLVKETQEFKSSKEFVNGVSAYFPKIHYTQSRNGVLNFEIFKSRF